MFKNWIILTRHLSSWYVVVDHKTSECLCPGEFNVLMGFDPCWWSQTANGMRLENVGVAGRLDLSLRADTLSCRLIPAHSSSQHVLWRAQTSRPARQTAFQRWCGRSSRSITSTRLVLRLSAASSSSCTALSAHPRSTCCRPRRRSVRPARVVQRTPPAARHLGRQLGGQVRCQRAGLGWQAARPGCWRPAAWRQCQLVGACGARIAGRA
jgi:hypothetical protein